MGFLKLIGAVSAAEHSKAISHRDETYLKERARLIDERDAANRKAIDFEAKFKRAVKDLEKQVRDNETAASMIASQGDRIHELEEERLALRPDAEKWRDRAARELQRGQAKRDAAAKAVAAKGRK